MRDYSKIEFKVTNNKISQVQRNQLKHDLEDDVMGLLKNACDWDISKVEEGILLEIPNDNEGVLPVAVIIKIKSLDTDTEVLKATYAEKQEAKKERERQKAEKVKKAQTKKA